MRSVVLALIPSPPPLRESAQRWCQPSRGRMGCRVRALWGGRCARGGDVAAPLDHERVREAQSEPLQAEWVTERRNFVVLILEAQKLPTQLCTPQPVHNAELRPLIIADKLDTLSPPHLPDSNRDASITAWRCRAGCEMRHAHTTHVSRHS